MTSTNRQSSNVGNLGDVLKHTALVAAATELLEATGPLLFADPYCFLRTAPFDRTRWSEALTQVPGDWYDPAAYVRLESERDEYLCSSGLVDEIWKAREAAFALGEHHDATRERLREQFRDSGHLVPTILSTSGAEFRSAVSDTATAIASDAAKPFAGALLLVDPFTWNDHADAVARHTIATLRGVARRVRIVCFDYGHVDRFPALEEIVEERRTAVGPYRLFAAGTPVDANR